MQINNVRYAHIRKNRHTSVGGGIAVAFYMDGPYVKFAISSCSPNDDYVKKIGRENALKDLEAGKHTCISMSVAKALRPGFKIKTPRDVIYAMFG